MSIALGFNVNDVGNVLKFVYCIKTILHKSSLSCNSNKRRKDFIRKRTRLNEITLYVPFIVF